MSGEGDLDSTEGHSQPIGGTLPLTDQSPPDRVSTEGDPQKELPPPSPSEAEGSTSTDTPTKDTPDSPPDLRDNSDKRVQNLVKAREETVTTPPPEESEQTVATPPSDNADAEGVVTADPSVPKDDSPTDFHFKDHPEAPLHAEDGSVGPPANKTQCVPPDDPFSRFWSGQTANTSDTNKRKHRWLTRKPECRHSINTEKLERQVPRPHRPKLYSRYPDASSVSFEYVEFVLQHIVQQWLREQHEEKLECEKRESEA